MIGVIFQFGTEIIEVRVNGSNVLFRTIEFDGMFSPIEGLKLNRVGAIKEFPELENDSEWRSKAIAKFKDKIKAIANEERIVEYIIEDLKKYGYVAIAKQKQGSRIQKLGGTNAN